MTQQTAFEFNPAAEPPKPAIRSYHPMTRHKQWDRVARHGAADSPGGTGISGPLGNLSVAGGRTRGDFCCRFVDITRKTASLRRERGNGNGKIAGEVTSEPVSIHRGQVFTALCAAQLRFNVFGGTGSWKSTAHQPRFFGKQVDRTHFRTDCCPLQRPASQKGRGPGAAPGPDSVTSPFWNQIFEALNSQLCQPARSRSPQIIPTHHMVVGYTGAIQSLGIHCSSLDWTIGKGLEESFV